MRSTWGKNHCASFIPLPHLARLLSCVVMGHVEQRKGLVAQAGVEGVN